jgi:cytoskeletal protein RodZ
LLQLFYLGSFNLKNTTVQIDGNLLATARQKAKLSVNDVASSCSLSSQQILSLETGSDLGFFNDNFKIICAKKYINFLKINPEDVISIQSNDPDLNEVNNTDNNDEKNNSEIFQYQFLFARLKHSQDLKVLITILVLAAVLFIFYFFNEHDESEVNLNEFDTEIEIDNDPSSDVDNQINLFESVENDSTDITNLDQGGTIANNSTFEQLNEASCNNIFQSSDIQNYRTPNVPDKPNNYVHIKSNQELPLCIQSNNGDAKSFTVTDNDPLTFRGQAPFTLYVPNSEGVQVFFQGWQVRLDPNYQVIKLNSYKDPNLGGLE